MNNTQTYGKNMKLVKSFWKNGETFRMIPVDSSTPYEEMIYDPMTDMLVLLSKTEKENLQFLPRLDDDGDPQKRKTPRTKENPGPPYKQQRVSMRVQTEHFIVSQEEMIEWVHEFAVNADKFDFQKYFVKQDAQKDQKIITPQTPVLTDTAGAPLRVEK